MKQKTFAVIGLDRFGFHLAINLQKMGHEVIGVDADAEKVRRVADIITHAAIGDPTDEDVLRTLGIRNADVAIVALTENIQSGVLVTLMLKEMGMETVIAESTSEIHGRILSKVGADQIIFPEKDMGERLAKSLSENNIVDYIDLSDEYSIIELHVPKAWAGKSLRELNVRARYKITVIACRDGQGNINLSPSPGAPLAADGALIVIGPDAKIEELANL
ncbi:MAG: TrkA family potassium uptake protein [Clostridia bacterium]|nr:TrkA family potassium uptake protein [Clostridia bacterium]